jgi:hypothetical protein
MFLLDTDHLVRLPALSRWQPTARNRSKSGNNRRKYLSPVTSRSVTSFRFWLMTHNMRHFSGWRKCKNQCANLVPNRIAPAPL